MIVATIHDLRPELGRRPIEVRLDVADASGDVIEGAVVVVSQLMAKSLVHGEHTDNGSYENSRDDQQRQATAVPLTPGVSTVRRIDLRTAVARASTAGDAQTDARDEDAEQKSDGSAHDEADEVDDPRRPCSPDRLAQFVNVRRVNLELPKTMTMFSQIMDGNVWLVYI